MGHTHPPPIPTSSQIVALTGIISTVAGDGTTNYVADGPATSSGLYGPRGIAFDAAGNMYISDPNNNMIRKVSAV